MSKELDLARELVKMLEEKELRQQTEDCDKSSKVELANLNASDVFKIGELDFISIGTNDLIQYLIAVDRVNQEVAHMYDSCHPAVGRTLSHIIQTAHKRGKKVSICGELASDTRMLPLLLGLEVDGLSVTPRMYLRVKNVIRNSNFEQCSDLAQAALLMGSSEEIRNLIEQNDKHEDS